METTEKLILWFIIGILGGFTAIFYTWWQEEKNKDDKDN